MSSEVEELSVGRRRELFVALVAAQDEGLSVRESKEVIARRFEVGAGTVGEVEEEGLDGNWPPFGRG